MTATAMKAPCASGLPGYASRTFELKPMMKLASAIALFALPPTANYATARSETEMASYPQRRR